MALGSLFIDAQDYVPVLLENLCGMSCSRNFWLLGGGWFQCRMEALDDLFSIDVTCSQELFGVLRFGS